ACIGGRVAGLARRPSRGARKVGTATGCTRQVPSPAGIANWRLLAFPQIASCENWVTFGCDDADLPPAVGCGRKPTGGSIPADVRRRLPDGAGDDADAAPGRLGNGAAAAARMAYSAGAD